MRVDDGKGSAAHPQIAAGGRRVAVVWEQGGPNRGIYLREIASESTKAQAWTPRMAAISTLGADGSASYPAVAATATAIVAAWTQGAEHGSEIRVRRIDAPAPPVKTSSTTR